MFSKIITNSAVIVAALWPISANATYFLAAISPDVLIVAADGRTTRPTPEGIITHDDRHCKIDVLSKTLVFFSSGKIAITLPRVDFDVNEIARAVFADDNHGGNPIILVRVWADKTKSAFQNALNIYPGFREVFGPNDLVVGFFGGTSDDGNILLARETINSNVVEHLTTYDQKEILFIYEDHLPAMEEAMRGETPRS